MKKFYSFLLMAAVAVGAMADDFVSDGTGNVYTFNALSQIEGTGVTLQDDGSYLVAADFTISEGDVLQLQNNDLIKMGNNVRITVNGDADFAPADTAVVTRDAEDSNPKGFWMLGDNGNANLKNVTFEYVGVTFGGINSSLHADNCTFTLYNGKLNSSGALGFNASCDNNVVENCYFIENTLNAIGNGATNPVGIIIRNCLFWHNTTSNRNKPQINLTVGGPYDVLIADNQVIGGQFTMSGGIGLSNVMGLGHTGINVIEYNYIADNRYGITTIGGVDAIIRNNTMIDNHYETNPNNGGSCISIYDSSSSSNIYIEGNWMEGGFWGITIVTGEPNVNLGKIDDPEAEDYNPGNNTFVNNGFDGALYDLFNNGTGTVWAQGNTWNVAEQTEEAIEEVIYHQVDDPSKGLVIFMPPHQEDQHSVGYWLVLLDKDGNEVWEQLVKDIPEDPISFYQTNVALRYSIFGGNPNMSDDERPNVPFYFVVDGVRYGAEEADMIPVYGDPYENPLIENENFWNVPVGRNYVIRVLTDPETGEMFMQIARGTFGLDELMDGKNIAGVRYFNIMGQEIQEADGMTIVVTTYTDGTTKAVKVMK